MNMDRGAEEQFADARRLHLAGRLGEAEASYRAALALDGGNADAWRFLGDVLRSMSNPNAAMEAYQTALIYAPHHVSAHLGVAGILAAQGYGHAGLTILEALVRVAPDSAAAHKALAAARVQLRDPTRVQTELDAQPDAAPFRPDPV